MGSRVEIEGLESIDDGLLQLIGRVMEFAWRLGMSLGAIKPGPGETSIFGQIPQPPAWLLSRSASLTGTPGIDVEFSVPSECASSMCFFRANVERKLRPQMLHRVDSRIKW